MSESPIKEASIEWRLLCILGANSVGSNGPATPIIFLDAAKAIWSEAIELIPKIRGNNLRLVPKEAINFPIPKSRRPFESTELVAAARRRLFPQRYILRFHRIRVPCHQRRKRFVDSFCSCTRYVDAASTVRQDDATNVPIK